MRGRVGHGHQRGETQHPHFAAHLVQRRTGGVVRQGGGRNKDAVHCIDQLLFPREAARRPVAVLPGVGVHLPQQLFGADTRSFQRKCRAVGRADADHRIIGFGGAELFDGGFGGGGAARAVQSQLQNGSAGGGGVAGKFCQPQRHGGAALGTIRQNLVHQPFVGEIQQRAGTPGGGIGQGGCAVPQL